MRVCLQVKEGFPKEGALKLDGWGGVLQAIGMAWGIVLEAQRVDGVAGNSKAELGQLGTAGGGNVGIIVSCEGREGHWASPRADKCTGHGKGPPFPRL